MRLPCVCVGGGGLVRISFVKSILLHAAITWVMLLCTNNDELRLLHSTRPFSSTTCDCTSLCILRGGDSWCAASFLGKCLNFTLLCCQILALLCCMGIKDTSAGVWIGTQEDMLATLHIPFCHQSQQQRG